ncbi:uncharacterized protein LACBIDRAFT_294783 [Laccaria bicolor S238N-H82]|uniref:Predicted protein n=1 Tax=Laccaria bicolor (strain S238N-H82 / ATCC MYA-4686) TaxID=486041 RepID=B0DI29_LACBS|nr:uncharacterized protein LACBIDRAFT_294783 [Laccaria bicolor S238N-H82]EDR05836.1 predicted protein [Laccaria bicolor S238N-H82]|eukprot:XP_001883512.1 predicted protein [Laccaria bicolor S238N-H82]
MESQYRISIKAIIVVLGPKHAIRGGFAAGSKPANSSSGPPHSMSFRCTFMRRSLFESPNFAYEPVKASDHLRIINGCEEPRKAFIAFANKGEHAAPVGVRHADRPHSAPPRREQQATSISRHSYGWRNGLLINNGVNINFRSMGLSLRRRRVGLRRCCSLAAPIHDLSSYPPINNELKFRGSSRSRRADKPRQRIAIGRRQPIGPIGNVGQFGNRCPTDEEIIPKGAQPHHSVTPEAPSTDEREAPNARYERHLLVEHHGFPLWAPQPHSRLPLSYRRKGVSIGDVGVITKDGYFDFLFNICLPRGHASNPTFLPTNFSPVYLLPTDVSELRQHDLGSCLLTSTTEKLRGLSFRCNGPEGSILVMPNGAYHEDLLNLHKFQRIAVKNAENWYKFTIGTCGRAIKNGELRLVTGCDKTNLWGIATYSDFPPGAITLAANTAQSPVEYTWDYEGRVEAKAGPRLEELLDDAGNQEYPRDTRNQCTFLRSFTVSLPDDVWESMVSTLVPDSSDNHILNFRQPRSYFDSIISMLLGLENREGSANVANDSLGGEKLTMHPATLINKMLLRQDEIAMPDAFELLGRIRQTFLFQFDDEGTVYLSQHAPEANPKQQFSSPDTTPRYPGSAQGTFPDASDTGRARRAPRPRARENRIGEPSDNDADVQDVDRGKKPETNVVNPYLLDRGTQPQPSSRVFNQQGNVQGGETNVFDPYLLVRGKGSSSRVFNQEGIDSPSPDVLSDPVRTLNDLCQHSGLYPPHYEVARSGPAHAEDWTVVVTVNDIEYGRGTASSKNNAKRAAAEIALSPTTMDSLKMLTPYYIASAKWGNRWGGPPGDFVDEWVAYRDRIFFRLLQKTVNMTLDVQPIRKNGWAFYRKMIRDDADHTVALTTTGRGNHFDIEEVCNIDEDANHDISNVFYAAQLHKPDEGRPPPLRLIPKRKSQTPPLPIRYLIAHPSDLPHTSPQKWRCNLCYTPFLLTPFKVPREAHVVEPEDWYWKSPMMETSGGCWEARLGGTKSGDDRVWRAGSASPPDGRNFHIPDVLEFSDKSKEP